MLKLGLLNENMDKYPTDLTAVDECAEAVPGRSTPNTYQRDFRIKRKPYTKSP